MTRSTVLAATAFIATLAAGSAFAADMGADARYPGARTLTVQRTAVALDCTPIPTIVAPGRRGMGEPGTYYARWDYRVPRACRI